MIPYFKSGKSVLYYGDADEIPTRIEKNSVHCVITSPPYWGKRQYGDFGELGLEKTPDEYVDKLVGIFSGIRQVMHPTGTLWLNIDDTNCVPSTKREGEMGMKPGVPAKNRIGIPWKVALALQKDGWWLRAPIIWYKPNAPREPVKDRPTYEHEYVFLLTKKAHYYYDQVAIFQKIKAGDKYAGDRRKIITESGGMFHGGHNRKAKLGGKNIGTVWDIPTKATTDPHYAAFPPKLVSRCIRAGSSLHGCCSKCKAPYKRIYKRENDESIPETIGWEATCKCTAEVEPCVVLDPFMGRGTTALVAEKLNRYWVGVEKDDKSCDLIKRNLHSRKYGLEPITKMEDGFFSPDEINIEVR